MLTLNKNNIQAEGSVSVSLNMVLSRHVLSGVDPFVSNTTTNTR